MMKGIRMERRMPEHYTSLIADLEHHGIRFEPIYEHEQFGPHLIVETTGDNRGKIVQMLNHRVESEIREEKKPQKVADSKSGGWNWLRRIAGMPERDTKREVQEPEITPDLIEHYMPKTSAALDVLKHKGGVGTGDLARSALEDWARVHAKGAFVDATPLKAVKKGERKVAIRVVPRNGPR